MSGTKDYWSNFFTRQHVIQWELFSSDFVEQVPGEIRGVHEHGSEPGTDPLQPVDPGNPTQSPGHQEGHQGSDCHVLRAGGCIWQHDGGQGQEVYLSFLFCHQLFFIYFILKTNFYLRATKFCQIWKKILVANISDSEPVFKCILYLSCYSSKALSCKTKVSQETWEIKAANKNRFTLLLKCRVFLQAYLISSRTLFKKRSRVWNQLWNIQGRT